jgi:redox-sensing transcriptional repressor
MRSRDSKLPFPVIRRLPKYLTHARELIRANVDWISSRSVADALGLTSSTVRQDLSHLDLTGVSKRGYEVVRLERVLAEELGAETEHRCVIVGAGNLGCALALQGDFITHGFDVCAIFDNNPEVIGTRVGRLTIRPMEALRRVVRSRKVEIGIIAVPALVAQTVALQLAEAGVKGLLNLAYVHIRMPADLDAVVVDARILASLQELAYSIRKRAAGARAASKT